MGSWGWASVGRVHASLAQNPGFLCLSQAEGYMEEDVEMGWGSEVQGHPQVCNELEPSWET